MLYAAEFIEALSFRSQQLAHHGPWLVSFSLTKQPTETGTLLSCFQQTLVLFHWDLSRLVTAQTNKYSCTLGCRP